MFRIWSRRKQWSLTPPGLFHGLKLPLPPLPSTELDFSSSVQILPGTLSCSGNPKPSHS